MRREFTADGTEYAEITGGKEWPKESSSIFFGSFSASSVDSASSAVFSNSYSPVFLSSRGRTEPLSNDVAEPKSPTGKKKAKEILLFDIMEL